MPAAAPPRSAREPVAVATTLALLAAVFLIDLLLDFAFRAGVASAVPYVAPVLYALRVGGRGTTLAVAAAATLLAVVGFFLPGPTAADLPVSLWNRCGSLIAIWVTAVFGELLVARSNEVREREVRLRTVLATSPDAILTLEPDGRIETANAAAVDLFGRPPLGLVGQHLIGLIDPPDDDLDVEVTGGGPAAVEILSTADDAGTGLAAVAAPDARRTVRWTVRPLGGGRRLVVGHDLTDLLEAQRRSVQTERLAAIGRTLATMSHETRNELVALKFGLEQLGRSWDDRDAAADMIGGLLEIRERLSRLFEDVRGYAAPIRLASRPTSLARVWRRAWDALPGRDARDVRLIEAVAGEADCVADPFRLEQVFRNLFENALAACDDPVVVKVSCERGVWKGEPALVVTVRDDGPGLTAECRERLFEPFFTTKPQGTGLGLSLCRRILEAHRGDLSAGPPGPGAEFVLTLPIGDLARPATEPADEAVAV